jgi:putative SOS response-associated peptidase YedK
MCARYSLTKEGISILIGEIEIIISIGARYNIAPKQIIPVIFNNGGKFQEKEMTWGWNANFSDQPLINAKSVTAFPAADV